MVQAASKPENKIENNNSKKEQYNFFIESSIPYYCLAIAYGIFTFSVYMKNMFIFILFVHIFR